MGHKKLGAGNFINRYGVGTNQQREHAEKAAQLVYGNLGAGKVWVTSYQNQYITLGCVPSVRRRVLAATETYSRHFPDNPTIYVTTHQPQPGVNPKPPNNTATQ